jgi:hypothetical protein
VTISGEHIVIDGDDSVDIIAGEDDDGTVLIKSAGDIDLKAGVDADDDGVITGKSEVSIVLLCECMFNMKLVELTTSFDLSLPLFYCLYKPHVLTEVTSSFFHHHKIGGDVIIKAFATADDDLLGDVFIDASRDVEILAENVSFGCLNLSSHEFEYYIY